MLAKNTAGKFSGISVIVSLSTKAFINKLALYQSASDIFEMLTSFLHPSPSNSETNFFAYRSRCFSSSIAKLDKFAPLLSKGNGVPLYEKQPSEIYDNIKSRSTTRFLKLSEFLYSTLIVRSSLSAINKKLCPNVVFTNLPSCWILILS